MLPNITIIILTTLHLKPFTPTHMRRNQSRGCGRSW